MSLVAIKAAIVALVGGLSEIENAFDYGKNMLTAEIAAYPVAVILPNGITSRIETNQHNLRTYNFNVWIMMEAEAVNLSTAQGTLEAAVDAVQNELAKDDNIDLGGLVEYTNPPNVSFVRADIGGSNVALWANLVLECNKLVNIYSL